LVELDAAALALANSGGPPQAIDCRSDEIGRQQNGLLGVLDYTGRLGITAHGSSVARRTATAPRESGLCLASFPREIASVALDADFNAALARSSDGLFPTFFAEQAPRIVHSLSGQRFAFELGR
jgi:hypothetical protein